MDNKKIGKLISTLRRQQGLTQQDLGDKVGVGFRAVSKWERGITLPDIGLINDLSKILGITSDELLAGELKKENKTKSKKKTSNIKITISIITTIILIITSIFILYTNKTYVYDIKSIDGADYYIEGQVTYKNKELSIIVNKLYFKDKEFASTVIKNYEYDILSGENHIFGYSLGDNGTIMEDKLIIDDMTKTFQINYSGKTDITKTKLTQNNLKLFLRFTNKNNKLITKELTLTLISQKTN